MGSLRRVLPVGAFPFDDGGDLAWRAALDDWLRLVAEHLFASVRFRLGLVGWTEPDLDGDSEGVTEHGIPDERWVGYLVPSGSGLTWYPPNQGAPLQIERP
jgi:hypothetical protein